MTEARSRRSAFLLATCYVMGIALMYAGLGVLAAFGWSLYALFFGEAGEPGMRMSFHLIPERGAGSGEIYRVVPESATQVVHTVGAGDAQYPLPGRPRGQLF